MRVPTTIFGQHVWFHEETDYDRRALEHRSVEARLRRTRPRRNPDSTR